MNKGYDEKIRQCLMKAGQAHTDYLNVMENAKIVFFKMQKDTIVCPECGKEIKKSDLMVGRRTNCPACGRNLLSAKDTENLMSAYERYVDRQRDLRDTVVEMKKECGMTA